MLEKTFSTVSEHFLFIPIPHFFFKSFSNQFLQHTTDETCRLSEAKACDGSPHYFWAPQGELENTIVCGAPNEVANIPDSPAAETTAFQFQGGK